MSGYITIKDIVAETGIPIGTVFFWADNVVIVANDGFSSRGRGKERRYDVQEMQCVKLAACLSRLGLPIGVVKCGADALRRAGYKAKAALYRDDGLHFLSEYPSDVFGCIGDNDFCTVIRM